MKSRSFRLSHDQALMSCIELISSMPLDGSVEVVVRNAQVSKTLAQLGGLFGSWMLYLEQETGRSSKYWHHRLKHDFLARIYATEPMNDYQKQWVELLVVYQEKGEIEKMREHAARISLSWITRKQMTQYMECVDNYFMDEGMPLPILDKFRKYYEREC